MKKISWIVACLLLPLMAGADVMDDILNGTYNARTLSVEQQDSLLNDGGTIKDGQNETLTGKVYELRYRNRKQLFRRSFEADYYLWDVNKKVEVPLCDGPVRDAQMSPNGKYVVYAKGHNLYIYKVDFNTEVAITKDSDQIFNGISDWLYEEEFGVTRLFAFSPDSKQVAFVRLDETEVPTFVWQDFLVDGKWNLTSQGLYPREQSLRYPKAGESNAQASVCVYDIYYKSVKTMQLGDTENWYLPRVSWTNGLEVVVEKVNRDQNEMQWLLCNPKSTISHLLYKEKSNKYYLDYSLFDESQWLSDDRFVMTSEKDGYRRLYLMNRDGSVNKCLTPQNEDVTALYAINEASGYIYYQAAPTPETRQVYALNIKKGTRTALGKKDGINTLRLSADYSKALLGHESNTNAIHYTWCAVKGDKLTSTQAPGLIQEVNDANAQVQQAWQAAGLPNKEFFRFVTERGDTLHCWRILPSGFDATKQYPVVLMQYSGPASQQVLDRWRKRFGHYLASIGYVVVNADPRGTDCRGRAWRNMTYLNLGEKEAEDQLSMAQYMAQQPYVDAARIAMVGWSYGGYQTIRTMCEQDNELIKCGIAVAPVTDWRLYDSGYTERYMQRPQVNDRGYEDASLLNKAANLKGHLLIVHGLSDDNVHVQNTWLLTEALVDAGKQFDMQVYVDDNHFMKHGKHYRHLHDKMVAFLKDEFLTK